MRRRSFLSGPDLDTVIHEQVMRRKLGKGPRLIPRYSADIDMAWQIVAKLGAVTIWAGDGWCHCRFGVDSHEDVSCAKTAPHAICLAALKACGVTRT